jgi:hypothetical protein
MLVTFREAAPISRRELEDIGWKVREVLGFTEHRWLPVAHVIEHMLPQIYGEDFAFRVGLMSEMGSNHGYADPDQRELVLREDVYDGLVEGRGRDRMTGVHETSHLILHPGNRLFRTMREERPPAFRDPEWQAKCLAGTIMMPVRMLDRCNSRLQIAREFGVSDDAAATRLKQIGRMLPLLK